MDLFETFELQRGAVVAMVGGGGKTSVVYALGDRAAEMGLSAVVASTTRFTRRPGGGVMPQVVEAADGPSFDALQAAVAPSTVVVASAGAAAKGRMQGYAPETVDRWAGLGVGLIAVEADGSAHRAFKAPASHEPVIPSSATDVVVCVGLDVLGKPLTEEHVHRAEIVAALGRTEIGAPVTIETVLRVLTNEEGGRKGVPAGARLQALLNAPATEEQRALGAKLAGRLIFGGYYRAVVGTIHRAEIDTIAC